MTGTITEASNAISARDYQSKPRLGREYTPNSLLVLRELARDKTYAFWGNASQEFIVWRSARQLGSAREAT